MNTKNDFIPNEIPYFVDERDVFGQIKPKRMNVFKRFKHKSRNAPELKVTYSSLGLRTMASLIDLTIILCTLLILETFLFNFNYTNNDFNSYRFFISIFTWIFYNGLFESSVYQATPGKMIFKLKVIDLYGKRMSVLRASFRCISKIFSILPIGLGIWYITTDPKKRGWHDLISGSYVIKSGS